MNERYDSKISVGGGAREPTWFPKRDRQLDGATPAIGLACTLRIRHKVFGDTVDTDRS